MNGAPADRSRGYLGSARGWSLRLEETLEILSDPRLLRRVRMGAAEVDRGQSEVLTKDEALGRVRRK